MTADRDPEMAEPIGTSPSSGGLGPADLPSAPTAPSTPAVPSTPADSPTPTVSPADARRALAMDGSIAESAAFPRPSASTADAAMTAAGSAAVPGQTTIADPLIPPSTGAPPPPGTTRPSTTDTAPKGISRRKAAARGGIRLVQFVFGVALFVVGVWIGTLIFQANQKPSDVAAAGGISNGIPAPPVVQEFADALARGGPDAVRSSMTTDVFALLTNELDRWSYATITKVDVLGTAQDGPRTATGLILTGRTTDGRTMWINLVVHTDDGKISTLR